MTDDAYYWEDRRALEVDIARYSSVASTDFPTLLDEFILLIEARAMTNEPQVPPADDPENTPEPAPDELPEPDTEQHDDVKTDPVPEDKED